MRSVLISPNICYHIHGITVNHSPFDSPTCSCKIIIYLVASWFVPLIIVVYEICSNSHFCTEFSKYILFSISDIWCFSCRPLFTLLPVIDSSKEISILPTDFNVKIEINWITNPLISNIAFQWNFLKEIYSSHEVRARLVFKEFLDVHLIMEKSGGRFSILDCVI